MCVVSLTQPSHGPELSRDTQLAVCTAVSGYGTADPAVTRFGAVPGYPAGPSARLCGISYRRPSRVTLYLPHPQAVDYNASGDISVDEYKLLFKCLGLSEEVGGGGTRGAGGGELWGRRGMTQ